MPVFGKKAELGKVEKSPVDSPEIQENPDLTRVRCTRNSSENHCDIVKNRQQKSPPRSSDAEPGRA